MDSESTLCLCSTPDSPSSKANEDHDRDSASSPAALEEDKSNRLTFPETRDWDSLGKLNRVVSWADACCEENPPFSTPTGKLALKPRPATSERGSTPLERGSTSTKVSEASGCLNGATTVMIRNISAKYTHKSFIKEINKNGFLGRYDFMYFPMDSRNRINRGFAFLNLETAEAAREFYDAYHGRKLGNSGSAGKVLEIAVADVQGFEANARQYLSSKGSRRHRDLQNRPLFFGRVPADPEHQNEDNSSTSTSTVDSQATELDGQASSQSSTSTPRRVGGLAEVKTAGAIPRFCTFCGSPRNLGHTFCPYCGGMFPNVSPSPPSVPCHAQGMGAAGVPTQAKADFNYPVGQWVMCIFPAAT